MHSILAGNRLLSRNSPLLFNILARSAYKIKRLSLPLPIERRSTETFWGVNIRLERPLSPCLSIYKKRFPLFISISHRITGLIQNIGIVAFSLSAIILPCDFNFYFSSIDPNSIPASAVCIGKGLIAFPVIFHLCTGVRHLIIDYGPRNLLRIKNVYTTGYIVLIATILLTVAAVMV